MPIAAEAQPPVIQELEPQFTGVPPEILASATRKLTFVQAKREAAQILRLEQQRRNNIVQHPSAPEDAAGSPERDNIPSPLNAAHPCDVHGPRPDASHGSVQDMEAFDETPQTSWCDAASVETSSWPLANAQRESIDEDLPLGGSLQAEAQVCGGDGHTCHDGSDCSMCEICQCAYEEQDEVMRCPAIPDASALWQCGNAP